MNSSVSALIALNNYIHDMAIAMLAASGAVLWIVLSRQGSAASTASLQTLVRLHRSMSHVVIFCLVLITACAIPRILFFRSLELARAVEDRFTAGLTARHILSLITVVAGVWLWMKVNRRMKHLAAAGSDKAPPARGEDG
ncbi:MAG: hypothetical protein M0Z79_10655 [Nitrospiraceae bacterium]|nr:hypothetical protein [Nitrospiraceae bacterium]